MRIRMEPGPRLAAVFSPARQFGNVRPQMIGGLVVALALVGVIVWLAFAGGGGEGEREGTQLRIPLKEAPAEMAEEAPPSVTEGHEAAPETSPAKSHEGGGEAAKDTGHETPAHETGEPAPAGESGQASDAAAMVLNVDNGPPLAGIDPVLLQPSSHGPLPIIGPDGRRPWQIYARPFEADEGTPRLPLIVSELGFSRQTIEAALRLPPEVTLSFSPYAPDVADLIAAARNAGHEVLLDMPMEPTSYPADDPGPETLLTALSATDNIERLETVLGRAQGYVGVISHMGSKFTTSPEAMRPVLSVLAERGLLFVDGRTSATSVTGTLAEQLKLPRALNDRFIDNEATRLAIDEGLAAVESVARRQGVALGVGRPFPMTLDRLAVWLPTLKSRGIALAPVSAVVDRQKSQ